MLWIWKNFRQEKLNTFFYQNVMKTKFYFLEYLKKKNQLKELLFFSKSFISYINCYHHHPQIPTCSPVAGSSKGSSICACLRKTLPRHARHSMRSKDATLSRRITPATNLGGEGGAFHEGFGVETSPKYLYIYMEVLLTLRGLEYIL